MDLSWGIFLLFIILVVLLPFMIAVFTGYEAPRSFGESLQRCAQGALTGSIVMTGMNFGRVGFDLDRWYWETLLVIPALIALQLLIDWLAIRQNAKRTTI